MFADSPEGVVKKEREKARKLRKTQWWRNKLSFGLCHYCGKKFSCDKLTMDHVVPLARGGKSNKGNIVAACKDCNSSKVTTIPVEDALKSIRDSK